MAGMMAETTMMGERMMSAATVASTVGAGVPAADDGPHVGEGLDGVLVGGLDGVD